MSNTALLVIDLQNDYFPNGNYPLWQAEETLQKVQTAIVKAQQQAMPIIFIQHVANVEKGIAPFFNEGTEGVQLHSALKKVLASSHLVVKHFADSFEQTVLASVLKQLRIDSLLICGMMTQNCVTHTAISKSAESYDVAVIAECCTTVDEMIHNIALNGMSPRVALLSIDQAFSVNSAE
ncbi:isochorismatase family protein [Marinomonas posidonica]|uniref:Isochorismatase hydrolase n=1 Tax=Marinomonas posidonica (strain CECT 7376 / NCIMB 14433 / IVIA-Po-181) TaxID=491952 RepID=F6CSX1_MARPP|nr:isochorismatase family protein [Marinomonas posidonica]AEF53961.1 isochorismatase hydrolase [Marinomonas posidonica IVIA-Po-181]